MPTKKSVLLAPNQQIEFDDPRVRYPALGSLKFDGTRCICVAGELLSRSMKPQKNENLPDALGDLVKLSREHGLVFDFELYDHTLPNHGAHTSILAAHSKPIPDSMVCHIFDMLTIDEWEGKEDHRTFARRAAEYRNQLDNSGLLRFERYEAVEQVGIESADDARRLFDISIEDGFEGVMLRCPDARYKHGRSTINEGLILKFKDFHTVDGVIVEVVQRRKLKEGIERTETLTGHMERVHTKDSYELDEMVGAFRIRFEDGSESEVNYGRGFPHEIRRQHWQDRDSLLGQHVEVRHLPHGAKDGIRIGTLLRFRPDKE